MSKKEKGEHPDKCEKKCFPFFLKSKTVITHSFCRHF